MELVEIIHLCGDLRAVHPCAHLEVLHELLHVTPVLGLGKRRDSADLDGSAIYNRELDVAAFFQNVKRAPDVRLNELIKDTRKPRRCSMRKICHALCNLGRGRGCFVWIGQHIIIHRALDVQPLIPKHHILHIKVARIAHDGLKAARSDFFCNNRAGQERDIIGIYRSLIIRLINPDDGHCRIF